jgi:polyferredoxin
MCVVTCPTGIDIRDGLQMECVGCTQCIDACDEVMTRLDKPRGLIRYSSRRQLAGQPRRLLRARTVVYGAALLLGFAAMATLWIQRASAEIAVLRVHGNTFELLPSGEVSNSVRVRIVNQSPEPRTYTLEVAEPGFRLITSQDALRLQPAELGTISGFVAGSRELLPAGRRDVRLRIADSAGEVHERRLRFLGPTTPAGSGTAQPATRGAPPQ